MLKFPFLSKILLYDILPYTPSLRIVERISLDAFSTPFFFPCNLNFIMGLKQY